MYDYHIHSEFSRDSETSLGDIIMSAEKMGLKDICVTDHFDVDPVTLSSAMVFDWKEVRRTLQDIENPGIAVKLGVELGVNKESVDYSREFLAGKEFDFVLCSQHYVDKEDPYYDEFFEDKTLDYAYERYLLDVHASLAAFSDYDVVGHLGYLSKCYRGKNPRRMEYSGNPEIIDSILRIIVDAGKGIELNTSSVALTGEPMACYSIVKRFLELGGEILTLGSDSHTSQRVGAGVADAMARLKEIGAKYVCTFEKRVPTFNSI